MFSLAPLPDIELKRSISTLYRHAGSLMDSARKQVDQVEQGPSQILNGMIQSMDQILRGLESVHSDHLDPSLRLPGGLRERKLPVLAGEFFKIHQQLPKGPLSEILKEKVIDFCQGKNGIFRITRRSVRYMEELIRRLSEWDWKKDSGHFCALQKFLVYMNFNSKQCMDHLLSTLLSKVPDLENDRGEAMMVLLDIQKDFQQLHRKPGVALNPDYFSLDDFLRNFLSSEIDYLNVAKNRPKVVLKPVQKRTPPVLPKLTCNLSADQISIILRLLDEERIVEARSLSQVYWTIVPYLSSKNKKVLSPDSLRTKSYYPEQSDLDRVRQTLNGMLDRVNGY